MQDTTTICIDSCYWPPSLSLAFSRFDAPPYVPRDNMPYCFSLSFDSFIPGDADGDGLVDPGDVVHLLNYLYRGGSAPDPLAAGDCNCDGEVGPGDVVYLISFLFRGGAPPSC